MLSGLCYTFKNGPFKNALIENGYDPRIDKNSISLQFFLYQPKRRQLQPALLLGRQLNDREIKAATTVQIIDCQDPSVREFLEKYIRTSKQSKFDVRSIEHVWLV